MAASLKQIERLLGKEAEGLLTHKCKTIGKVRVRLQDSAAVARVGCY